MKDRDRCGILDLLARGVTITTRLRETGSGDVHDVLHPIDGATGCDDMIGCLIASGAEYEEQVHPLDPSEYRVVWKLIPGTDVK